MDEPPKQRDKIKYVSEAYSTAEGLFPIWEAAFAIIVGQLFVAYFDSNVCPYQQKWLAFIGCIICGIWFILVSLNYQNALHLTRKMEVCLKEELQGCGDHFILPWPTDEDKEKWTLWKIFWGTEDPLDWKWIKKLIRSTWFYRRFLPFILFISLLWLGVGPILPILIIYILFYIAICSNINSNWFAS